MWRVRPSNLCTVKSVHVTARSQEWKLHLSSCCELWGVGSTTLLQPFVEKKNLLSRKRCWGCPELDETELVPGGSKNIKCVKMCSVPLHRAEPDRLKNGSLCSSEPLPPFLKPSVGVPSSAEVSPHGLRRFWWGRGVNDLKYLKLAAHSLFLFYCHLILRGNNLVILCSVFNRKIFQFSRLSWAVQQIPPAVLGRSSTVLLEKIRVVFSF